MRAFTTVGVVLLLVDVVLVGIVLWERYPAHYSLEDETRTFMVTSSFLFEPRLVIEVSYKFTVMGINVVLTDVEISDSSGVVWAHQFELRSPGVTVETKSETAYADLSPGTYSISSRGAPTEVDQQFLALPGQFLIYGLVPALAIVSVALLAYAGKPDKLILDIRKDFLTSVTGLLEGVIVLGVVWGVLILLQVYVIVDLHAVLNLIILFAILGVVAAIYEALKKMGGKVKDRLSA
jgi:hypothetical protein